MADPSVYLGGKVFSALRADADLSALTSTRVYDGDSVPAGVVYPFITVKFPDITEDDDGCGKHWISTIEVHAWSRSGNSLEVRTVNGAVRSALDGILFDYSLTVDTTTITVDTTTITADAITAPTPYNLNYQQYRQTRIMDDPDGLSSHGIVIYEFSLREVE